jgi:solute carrier family 27 fatty acid transporter 1/4
MSSTIPAASQHYSDRLMFLTYLVLWLLSSFLSLLRSSCLCFRVAHWAISQGLQVGDVVGLMMENRAEFIITWLGLTKVGVVTALLNTNLKQISLKHSIETCHAHLLIVGFECLQNILEISQEISHNIWVHTEDHQLSNYQNLSSQISFSINLQRLQNFNQIIGTVDDLPSHTLTSAATFKAVRKQMNSSSLLFYIFTSGTTGLPKAAKIKHARFALAACSFSVFFGVYHHDRVYCPLPLYHSAGGIIGVSLAWYNGATLVLK